MAVRTEPRLFCKNNHRDSDKNKFRTFEPRGGEKLIELSYFSLNYYFLFSLVQKL